MVKRYETQDRVVEGAIVGGLAGGVTGGPGGALLGGVFGAALGTKSYRDPIPRDQKQLSDYSLIDEGTVFSVEKITKKLEGLI